MVNSIIAGSVVGRAHFLPLSMLRLWVVAGRGARWCDNPRMVRSSRNHRGMDRGKRVCAAAPSRAITAGA